MTPPINVNMLSATDLQGGAGIAAYRLLHGLRRIGVTAELIVQDKKSCDAAVSGPRSPICKGVSALLPYVDPLPKFFYTNRHRGAWSCNFFPNPCLSIRQLQKAEIIHLHWVGGGLLPIRTLSRLQRPIVWTLHDAWPFTGGCHITYDCDRYQEMCGECPQLQSQRGRDLSHIIWKNKSKHWQGLEMTVVAPSRWMASLVSSSSLFGDCLIEVIPNGLDLEVFYPIDKSEARRILGLPQNARLFLFSAFGGFANWNKGGDLLGRSINVLLDYLRQKEVMLMMTGSGNRPSGQSFPVPIVDCGLIRDESKKRLIYAAADLTVVPSRSENLCYVAMESMACGTPCVAFSVGGFSDIISHSVDGYLAKPFSVEDFANGMKWILEKNDFGRELSVSASSKVAEKFNAITIARQYERLYRRISKN